MRQMQKLFGKTWRMDNPIVKFGLAPYQPNEEINLTVDNFATAGGLLRGLFSYLYTATTLTLKPLVPDTITSLTQKFGVRWGPYKLQISTSGVRSSGIASVTVNKQPLPPAAFTAASVSLTFATMPPASKESMAAISSEISNAHTDVAIEIAFKTRGKTKQKTSGMAEPKMHDEDTAVRHEVVVDPPTAGMTGWFHAADLKGSVGSNISSWTNRVSGGPAAEHPGSGSCANVGAAAPPVVSKAGALFERPGYLCSMLPAAGPKSFVAAFTAASGKSETWGCLLCGRGVAGGDAAGFDGVAVGGPGPQVDLDWTGSGDNTHRGYAVGARPTVAIATFGNYL